MKRREKEKAGKPHTPTKRESIPPKYINWKSPAYWPLIDQVVRQQIGKPNLSEIVRQLRERDPQFDHFSHRRLSEWRDPLVKDKIVWSEKTINEVRKEFLPGGIQTRFSIFVSLSPSHLISAADNSIACSPWYT